MPKKIVSSFSQDDFRFMKMAINLAKKNSGFTGNNPSVGCVIVKNNKIISSGVTAKNGRPHAENIAIQKIKEAKEDLTSATMYVTLEPCSHFGKTDPCADLIIDKKISRVVIALSDPDLRVNGQGIEKLQKNGIKVEVGLLSDEAKNINRSFFKAKLQNQPFVTLKLATSLDGKIALKNFDSKWITCEQSRLYGHYLRAKNNAILIGANSLRKDDSMLDCRIAGLEEFSPIRIILSNGLDLDLNSKIISSASKIETYIATNNSDQKLQERFLKSGIKIINFSNLNDLLSKICQIGVNSLLIEGGSKVSTAFLKEGLVDEIIHIQSSKILGNDAIAAIFDLNFQSLPESLNFKVTKRRIFGDDQVTFLSKE